jgi:hypothetical protein
MKENKLFFLSDEEFEKLHCTILPSDIEYGMEYEECVKLWESETGLSWLFHYDQKLEDSDSCFLVVDENRLILARLKYGF